MEEEDSFTCYFPEAFPISTTHGEFPNSFEKLEKSGLPYGLIVTPFIGRKDPGLIEDGVPATVESNVSRSSQ